MKHTLPELLEPKRATAWKPQPPPITNPSQPTANRTNRTIRASTENDEQAHAQRLAALIGSRYNSRRAKQLAQIWHNHPHALPLFHAAQELRNRYLATVTRPDLPTPRYYLPEQLAGHHATTHLDHQAAHQIAALIHHPQDLATYLNTLETRHNAQELAEALRAITNQARNQLDYLTRSLRNAPTARHKWRGTNGHLHLTQAENSALIIQQHLLEIPEAAAAAKKRQAKRHKQERQTQRRQTKERATGKPSATDLTGWYPVIFDKPERELAHTGRLGRKRIATNTGKNPNRIHNYAGDPARRIFTRKTRGTNALVIVDASGSMSLTSDELTQIMNASAGATVIAYSADDRSTPNTHLLAHKGRRVREIPRFAGNNGNDAPAADYAVKNYRKTGAPVLWITDGRATGNGHDTAEPLRKQCQRIAKRHGITIARSVAQALDDLALIRAGKRPPQRLDTFH